MRTIMPCVAVPTLLAALASCTGRVSVPLADADRSAMSLERREAIATVVHESVRRDFAHWDGVPALDLDALARAYHVAARAARDRRAFDLATKAFVAALHNSHTFFVDAWLDASSPGPLGFRARALPSGWMVTASRVAGLAIGDTIVRVDGRDIEAFFAEARRVIPASSDRIARQQLFNTQLVFPAQFALGLSTGRTVEVRRTRLAAAASADTAVRTRVLDSGVIYVRIPSFDGARFQARALEALEAHRAASGIIIDVRGNGGGNTPTALLRALLVAPAPWWREASTLRFNPFTFLPKQRLAASHGHPGQPRTIESARTISPRTIYGGPLVVLVDRWCASSCEDFVMPLRRSERAVLVGERTFGSTGQPRVVDLGDGMRLFVGAKRASFPDGAPFEGVGVTPQVELEPDVAALRSGRDVVLEAGLAALGRLRR